MTFSNKYSTYIIYKMPKKPKTENLFNHLPFAPTPSLSPLPSLSLSPIDKVEKKSPSKKKFTPVKKLRIISRGGKKSRRRTKRKSNKKYRNKSVSI